MFLKLKYAPDGINIHLQPGFTLSVCFDPALPSMRYTSCFHLTNRRKFCLKSITEICYIMQQIASFFAPMLADILRERQQCQATPALRRAARGSAAHGIPDKTQQPTEFLPFTLLLVQGGGRGELCHLYKAR